MCKKWIVIWLLLRDTPLKRSIPEEGVSPQKISS
jgi:hypothetical protein